MSAPHQAPTESLRLTIADSAWLEPLSGQHVTESWLNEANTFLQTGVAGQIPGSARVPEEVQQSREYFLGTLLGFGRPESTCHGAFERLAQSNRALIPLDRFVRVARIFASNDLLPQSAAKFCLSEQTLEQTELARRIDTIKNLLGSDATRAAVSISPRILAYPAYPRKISFMRMIAGQLGLHSDLVTELIAKKPNAINKSNASLLLSVRYAAEQTDTDATVAQVGNLLLESPDRILVALDTGIDSDVVRFTKDTVRKATQAFSVAQLRSTASEILASDERSRVISPATRRLHGRQLRGGRKAA